MDKLIEELRNDYTQKYNQCLEQIKTLGIAQYQFEGAIMALNDLAEKIKSQNDGHKEKKVKVKKEVKK